MKNLIVILFALILECLIYAILGFIMALVIVKGAEIELNLDLSEYFNFIWMVSSVLIGFTKG